MNDFTKEELENISDELEGTIHDALRQKIQSMVDNYCEHEFYQTSALINYCVKCGHAKITSL